MFIPRRGVVAPVAYDVEYQAPVQVIRTYSDNNYRQRSSGSYGGTCCCIISSILGILILAGLAVGLYFIIKSATDGDSTKNTSAPAVTKPTITTTGTTVSTTTTDTTTDTTDTTNTAAATS